MIRDNAVIFKGGKNGIIILIDNNAEYEHIKQVFQKKLIKSKAFFSKTETTITFKGKTLKDEQIMEMLDIIHKETDLAINFVHDSNQMFEVKKDIGIEKDIEKKIAPILQEINITSQTYLHMGSVRSGKSLESEDSIIILGDINAGAEVRSHKHVFVFGTARGMVHAGLSGDENSIVCALNLQATQLRIANLITYIPKEAIDNSKKIPTYAFISEGKIFISEI